MARTEKPPECSGCPQHKRGLGFVPGTGPSDSELAIIGQGPGEQEVETSQPFFPQAPAGSILTKWLHRATHPIQRSAVWIGNVTQCWVPQGYRGGQPYGSVDPSVKAQRWCWNAHVGPALLALPQLRLVVPVGAPARHFFLGPSAGERYCGTFSQGVLPPVEENHVGT